MTVMPDELASATFVIPVTFINGTEDYRYDAAGTLFVSVSYEDQAGDRPKSVVVFRQRFDGALDPTPIVRLTPAISYLGGRLDLLPDGQVLAMTVNVNWISLTCVFCAGGS